MSIFAYIIIFLGVISYLYFYWNRLKEDYTSNLIFSSAFFVLIGILIFYLTGRFLILPNVDVMGFNSGVLFWLSIFGSILGLSLGVWKYKLRFFETLEAYGVGLLYLVLSVFVSDTFINSSVPSLIASTVVSLLLTLFYFLETRYKNFSWYRSGRVGFSGLFTLGIFFLIRALVAIFFPFVISFFGKFESIGSGILTFILFLTVYNLSQRKQ